MRLKPGGLNSWGSPLIKSMISREILPFSLAMVSGVLVTLGLLLSIILLANYRVRTTEQHPLLVVNLMAWPAPIKQEKPNPTAKPKQQPAPEKPVAKKRPPPLVPKPVPVAKKVVKEKPAETVEAVSVEKTVANIENLAVQTPSQPTPTSTKSVENSLPTPVPTFQLTQLPRFLHREIPVYPEAMRAGGISGVVKLEALIDKEGRVRAVNILKSAGEYFDEAARQAVLASTFYPAKVDSEPVAVLLRLPVRFGLL